MARKKISQADARRYRKERDALQEKLDVLLRKGAQTYAGTDLGGLINVNDVTMANLRTARRLNFALFAIPKDMTDEINFRAVRPGEF